MLGAPGAGKGTQAVRVAEKLNVPHISTGDIFRDAIKSGSELGGKVKSYLDAGELVPDGDVAEVVTERLARDDCGGGYVLDGFPRTVIQAKNLDGMLAEAGTPLDVALVIDVSDEELVKRITARCACPECGTGYNLISQPPKSEGLCDKCGHKLAWRDDDNEETVRNRLKVYAESTALIIDYYAGKNLARKVDGHQDIEAVAVAIDEALCL